MKFRNIGHSTFGRTKFWPPAILWSTKINEFIFFYYILLPNLLPLGISWYNLVSLDFFSLITNFVSE